MKYTLRQIEIFLAAASTENISKAAAALSMSQSAASSSLSQLEHQFGVQLFERTGKSLRLSSSGIAMRNHAQQLIDQAHSFEGLLGGNENTGHLKIGASITIGNYLGVRYFSDYVANFPDIDAHFEISNSTDVISKVQNFELDIGLVEYEIHHKDLELIPWRKDQLQIFCSPKHPYASKPNLTSSDLTKARWILREPNSGTRQTFDRAMQGLLPKLDIFLELGHNEAIKCAVEANIGLGCLSEVALAANLKNGDLVPLALNNRSMHRHFYFVLNKHRSRTTALNHWIDLCSRDNGESVIT